MPDESFPPLLEKDVPPSKWRFLRSFRVLLCLILFMGTGAFFFLRPPLWHASKPNDQSDLKRQVTALSRRVAHLEDAQKALPMPSVNPKRLEDIDARITALREQVEGIQNQPKPDASPQESERLLTLREEVRSLARAQKTAQSALLFARLKARALSEAPYASELADFKKVAREPETLRILKKYANEGLQALKEAPKGILSLSPNETTSWRGRLKEMLNSLVKVEKMDAPLSSSRERQAVEEALSQIDQTLAQQLAAMPPPPSFPREAE